MIYFVLILVIGSGFFFQLMGVIEVRGDSFEIVDCLPMFCLAIVFIFRMTYSVYNLPQIKILLIKIQEYSLSAKSNEEHKIQNSHALFGRNFGYIYTYVILGHNLLYTTATLLTRFMHTQVEKNDTSSDEIISAQIGISYRVNYFVDFDTYYVPIFIHTSLCTLCYIILIVTFDVLYITFVEHCRGLFATVRYRLESALLFENDTYDSIKISTRDKSYSNVTYSIRRHTETLQFINIMNTVYSPPLFVQIGFSILILSVLGYQIITTANINRFLKHAAYMNGLLINIFFENWQGQRIIDSSEKVFASVCNIEWYNMPIAARKLLRLIMMRSLRPMILTAGKFMILSYITFNAVIRTSSSYFMLLRNMT
ncbi:odorant receptor 63a-like isoform X2 [Linepithema humile]|uniref:odorant receptor 63a-like isoform X2 n=1 Tax=Linepithema humile TaxID=83485 RepID=UPI00351E697A